MCKFASLVVTKDRALWLPHVDSHEEIISIYGVGHLDGVRCGLVRVEIVPPPLPVDASDLGLWDYRVDQDTYPDWTYRGDPILEARARATLAGRARAEKWFETLHAQHAVVGFGGAATSGDDGVAVTGDYGTAIAGQGGTAIAGCYGIATAGKGGVAKALSMGVARVGTAGIACAGGGGTAVAGDHAVAIAGWGGHVQAGKGGVLQLRWGCAADACWANKTWQVGVDGIQPDTLYTWADITLVPSLRV